ncbi:MAG: hypothetical protein FJZ58_02620 [Chlamydiae bacterium]|nr:hypothetical protein [Chlamydiota bacterium]
MTNKKLFSSKRERLKRKQIDFPSSIDLWIEARNLVMGSLMTHPDYGCLSRKGIYPTTDLQ